MTAWSPGGRSLNCSRAKTSSSSAALRWVVQSWKSIVLGPTGEGPSGVLFPEGTLAPEDSDVPPGPFPFVGRAGVPSSLKHFGFYQPSSKIVDTSSSYHGE